MIKWLLRKLKIRLTCTTKGCYKKAQMVLRRGVDDYKKAEWVCQEHGLEEFKS